MATTKRIDVPALAAGLLLASAGIDAKAADGLSTRDLNPLLQPVFLPSYRDFGDDDGWSLDHGFFITNTLQVQSRGSETLTIDVENYYYWLDFATRRDRWLFRASLPLIGNRSGQLRRPDRRLARVFRAASGRAPGSTARPAVDRIHGRRGHRVRADRGQRRHRRPGASGSVTNSAKSGTLRPSICPAVPNPI